MDRSQVEMMMEPITGINTSVTQKFDVKVQPDYTVITGVDVPKTGMVLTTEARDKLLILAGMPKKTIKKLSINTSNNVLTELMRQEGDLMLLHTDQHIIDILPVMRLRPVPAMQLLDILEDDIPDHTFHRVMRLDNHSIQIESIGSNWVDDVPSERKKGSVVQAGVVSRFSPMGLAVPEVQNFVLRLMCVNGMTSTEFINSYTTGPIDEVIPWYQNSIMRAYESLGGVLDKWNTLAEEGLSPVDRTLLLNGLIKAAKMPASEVEIIHQRALINPPETSYDVLQLLTWASSHVIEEPLGILRAQNAAASFIDEQQHSMFCPTCKRKQ